MKAVLLNGIFDLPARAIVTEMVQYNGNFGCGLCEDQGCSAETDKGGTVHVYPLKNLTGKPQIRTKERVLAQSWIALETKLPVSYVFCHCFCKIKSKFFFVYFAHYNFSPVKC